MRNNYLKGEEVKSPGQILSKSEVPPVCKLPGEENPIWSSGILKRSGVCMVSHMQRKEPSGDSLEHKLQTRLGNQQLLLTWKLGFPQKNGDLWA